MVIIILAILFSLILVFALVILIYTFRKRGISITGSIPYGLDPAKIGPTHAQVAGGLAGFTIAVVALIISLIGLDKLPPNELQFTIMLFLLAFFGYIAAAILFATVPGRSENIRGFTFILASFMYEGAQVLSIVAFQPLFVYLGYRLISIYLPFVPLLILLGGYFSIFSALSVLTGVKRIICNMIILSATAWVSLHFVISKSGALTWPETQLPWIIFLFIVQSLIWMAFGIPMTANADTTVKVQRVVSLTLGGLSLIALEYCMVGAFTF